MKKKKTKLSREEKGIRLARKRLREIGALGPPTPEEEATMKAALMMRAEKGAYVKNYDPQEIALIARARRLCTNYAEYTRALFLCLRRTQTFREKKFPPELGIHYCPKCGALHRDQGINPVRSNRLVSEEIEVRKLLLAVERIASGIRRQNFVKRQRAEAALAAAQNREEPRNDDQQGGEDSTA